LYLADALQILEQLALLGGQLRGRGEMLQGAAPANAEVSATRRGTIGRGNQHLDQARLVQVPAALEDAKAHALSGQSAFDEHGFALDARDTATVVRQIDDIGLLNRT
jgi:hypothetical protein